MIFLILSLAIKTVSFFYYKQTICDYNIPTKFEYSLIDGIEWPRQ